MTPIIKTEYVDAETGEVIPSKLVSRGTYIKKKCNKRTEKFGYNLKITYIWECEKNNQLKLTL